ncbi:hypothetical protein B0H63DRAFT_388006, partial [Podospora didyma]
QPLKQPFAGLLSRATNKSLLGESVRTTTNSSLSLSSLELSEYEKGPLGLTTLHESSSPVADVVFIHGLGGGSRKSWSYSPSPDHFWPLAWLPTDPDFTQVRIHTFGYKADWGERRQSILNIHDFAQSLLNALRNDPAIRRTSTRIILIGHSLGGNVAKKAYILARQDPAASGLAARVHSIFFLGTPHRGSDMAAILENMLAASGGRKPFVSDLRPNSAALEGINDAFRHYASDLNLWSFYETLPVRTARFVSRIVVERHSAVLGFPKEEIAAMDADHRHICKFSTPLDPNYKMLRNSLLTAVDMIKAAAASLSQSSSIINQNTVVARLMPGPASAAGVISRLRTFLAVHGSVEGNLETLQILREPGSCQWFTEKSCFASWVAGTAPGILWLMGRPAAGKSVLSTHVIEQLKETPGVLCSYFMFKTGESTLSDCFRSLAFQMALQDDQVRETLLCCENDGIVWDKTNDASVWCHLFVGTIFKLPSISHHCWILDGVDECGDFSAFFTKKFLIAIPEDLRLFATSRSLDEITRGLAAIGPNRVDVQLLSDADTLEDMRLFVNTRLTDLGRLDSVADREDMCEKIIKKSSGSFLWTRLVLQEFEDAWTREAMETILQSVSTNLHKLYSRMLRPIELDDRKMPLAKSILTIILLAARPLTVEELRCIVKLELNQTLQNAAKAIPDLCGQLVFVDQDNKVHVIHETVREFLLAENLGLGMAIIQSEGHTRLGSLLLKYLSSGVLKAQRLQLLQSSGRAKGFTKPISASQPSDLSLVGYASIFFSEHLHQAVLTDHDLMGNLCKFITAENIFSWIEHIAKGGELAHMTRSAVNSRRYLRGRLTQVSPADQSGQLVDGWISDLIHVAAKFSSQLLACPSSIHCLIPPLCPSSSVIGRSVSEGKRRSPISSPLVVKGLTPGTWDDCLARIDFPSSLTTAVSHGDHLFAIGLSSGDISIYHAVSFELLLGMAHPERVMILQFSLNDIRLASCGKKFIAIWDTRSSTMLHSFSLQSPPLAVSFYGANELLCASRSSELIKWTLDKGEHESISWKEDHYSYFSLHGITPTQPPSRVALLATAEDMIIAVGYRGLPVLIWNALESHVLGTCGADIEDNGIDAMVFNPNPETPLLVVSYQSGRLCVFDYITMELMFSEPSMCAASLACSLDGRTLVTGSNQGVMEVYDFESGKDGASVLMLIYRTNHSTDEISRGVSLSPDGLRFVDIRARQARVWAPAALETSMLDNVGHSEISTQLVASADGRFIIAGKDNGEVALFSTDDGNQVHVLAQHGRGTSIECVALGEPRNLIISADRSARVLVADLDMPLLEVAKTSDFQRARIILDSRFDGAVLRMLVNPKASRLLVIGLHDVELWEIPSEMGFSDKSPQGSSAEPLASPGVSWSIKRSEKFVSIFQHPSNPAWFVATSIDVARVYSWIDFAEVTPGEGIPLMRGVPVPEGINFDHQPLYYSWKTKPLYMCQVWQGFVVELFQMTAYSRPRVYVWPATTFDPHSNGTTSAVRQPAVESDLDAISQAVSAVLGMTGTSTLVFLDIDLWVCSVELQSVAAAAPPKAPNPQLITGFGSLVSSPSSSRQNSGPSLLQPETGHAKRHFFALSEWRTSGRLWCTLAQVPTLALENLGGRGVNRLGSSSPDVVFTDGTGGGIVVIKGGLDFSESVKANSSSTSSPPAASDIQSNRDTPGLRRNHVWNVVSGSMHRRSSNC